MIKGKVTIPTDIDMIDDTLRLIDLWGADAIRDSDGTKMPREWDYLSIKKYATYYTTRNDNEWAMKNPKEVQQIYLMTDFVTATAKEFRIDIMEHFSKEQFKPNTTDHITKWWEVIDRTIGEVVEVKDWYYNVITGEVIITDAKKYHSYTVSFLAFMIWDSIHLHNTIKNQWENEIHQMTYDVRQPKTQKYVFYKLESWLNENPNENPNVDVVRFTTFFHLFPLIFNEVGKEKFIDYFGYGASVSPYVLEKFEKKWATSFVQNISLIMGIKIPLFVIQVKSTEILWNFSKK